jgi:plasmid stability protein
MPKITIRNVPEGLHKRLKQRATHNRRSLNSELLTVLEEAVGNSDQGNRKIHEEIAGNPSRTPISDDPETLKQKYREGLA